MNWKHHIIFGLIFTISIMVLTNLILAIKGDLLAIDVIDVLFPLNELTFWVYSLPIIILYSLLPDMDHKQSKITGVFYGISFIIITISFITNRYLEINTLYDFGGMVIYGLVLMVSTWLISTYFKHRGITHTLWFGIIATCLLLLVGINYVIYYIIAFVSFWSHLLADKIPFKMRLKPQNSMFR